jgi:hypothetical protein
VEMLFPKLREVIEKYPDYFLTQNPLGNSESVVELII